MTHAPGLVVSNAHLIVEPFIYGGASHLLKNVTKKVLEAELRKLVMDAGYAGKFTLLVQSRVKGSPRTQGLRVGAPHARGVMISWHEGGNDNRIEMVLYCPTGTTRDTFYSALKKAEAGGDEEADENVGQTLRPSEPPRIALAASEGEPVAALPREAVTTARLATSSSGTGDSKSQESFKANQAAATELFMEEVAKVADPSGLIPRREMPRIVKALGYGWPGPVRAMIANGDLVRIGEGSWQQVRHRMSDAWMKTYPPQGCSVSTDALAPVAVVATPAEPLRDGVNSMAGEFRRMAAAVKEITMLEAQLKGAEEALKRNHEERETLLRHAKLLEQQRDDYTRRLAELCDLKAAIDELKSMIV